MADGTGNKHDRIGQRDRVGDKREEESAASTRGNAAAPTGCLGPRFAGAAVATGGVVRCGVETTGPSQPRAKFVKVSPESDDWISALIEVASKLLCGDIKYNRNTGTINTQVFQWPGILDSVGGGNNMSCDGNTLVGFLDMGADTFYHAVRITIPTGEITDLGTLGGDFSFATDVSCDGSVVVGFSELADNVNEHAFLWTEVGGLLDLGTSNGSSGFSRAFGVSSDGSVVVGEEGDRPFSATRPFLWTAAGGFQDLASIGSAYAITADGSVVVGQANYPGTAFRWTQAGGLQDLGTLPGFSTSLATGVSDDGQIVVGIAANFPGSYSDATGFGFGPDTRPFVWTAATGMQDLNTILANAGIDLTGISLYAITGISSDGQYVCGVARTPDNDPDDPNETSGFIAQLPQ